MRQYRNPLLPNLGLNVRIVKLDLWGQALRASGVCPRGLLEISTGKVRSLYGEYRKSLQGTRPVPRTLLVSVVLSGCRMVIYRMTDKARELKQKLERIFEAATAESERRAAKKGKPLDKMPVPSVERRENLV